VRAQLTVARLAAWVREQADKHGRKPMLLINLAALPIRALLFALIDNPHILVVVRVLGGITGAIIGLIALVIVDVMKCIGTL
jgi:MFS family permease